MCGLLINANTRKRSKIYKLVAQKTSTSQKVVGRRIDFGQQEEKFAWVAQQALWPDGPV